MTTLMQAHRQWSSRAPDERFTSLLDMQSFKRRLREQSHSTVISSRELAIEPTPDDVRGLMVVGDDAHDAAALTHSSFGLSNETARFIWRAFTDDQVSNATEGNRLKAALTPDNH